MFQQLLLEQLLQQGLLEQLFQQRLLEQGTTTKQMFVPTMIVETVVPTVIVGTAVPTIIVLTVYYWKSRRGGTCSLLTTVDHMRLNKNSLRWLPWGFRLHSGQVLQR